MSNPKPKVVYFSGKNYTGHQEVISGDDHLFITYTGFSTIGSTIVLRGEAEFNSAPGTGWPVDSSHFFQADNGDHGCGDYTNAGMARIIKVRMTNNDYTERPIFSDDILVLRDVNHNSKIFTSDAIDFNAFSTTEAIVVASKSYHWTLYPNAAFYGGGKKITGDNSEGGAASSEGSGIHLYDDLQFRSVRLSDHNALNKNSHLYLKLANKSNVKNYLLIQYEDGSYEDEVFFTTETLTFELDQKYYVKRKGKAVSSLVFYGENKTTKTEVLHFNKTLSRTWILGDVYVLTSPYTGSLVYNLTRERKHPLIVSGSGKFLDFYESGSDIRIDLCSGENFTRLPETCNQVSLINRTMSNITYRLIDLDGNRGEEKILIPYRVASDNSDQIVFDWNINSKSLIKDGVQYVGICFDDINPNDHKDTIYFTAREFLWSEYIDGVHTFPKIFYYDTKYVLQGDIFVTPATDDFSYLKCGVSGDINKKLWLELMP
ncbi:hypothetical protein ACF8CX_17650 [Vibrio mimicus]